MPDLCHRSKRICNSLTGVCPLIEKRAFVPFLLTVNRNCSSVSRPIKSEDTPTVTQGYRHEALADTGADACREHGLISHSRLPAGIVVDVAERQWQSQDSYQLGPNSVCVYD